MIPILYTSQGKNWAKEKKIYKQKNLVFCFLILSLFIAIGFLGVGYAEVSATGVIYGTSTAYAPGAPPPPIEVTNPTSTTQIQDALNNALPGQTVTTTLSSSLTNVSTINVQNGVSAEIDMNGNDFSVSAGVTVLSVSGGGDVTLKDSTNNGNADISGKNANLVQATGYSGTMNIEGININVSNGNTAQLINFDGVDGTLYLKNVNLSCTGKNSLQNNVTLTGSGTMYIENCNFSGARNLWVNGETSTFTIYILSGTFQNGKNPPITLGTNSQVIVSGGSFAYDISNIANVYIADGYQVVSSGGMYNVVPV